MATAPAKARIQVLPPELADQIAAGEVVERPASVVKELCENALDAGARRIEIEIEAGGQRLVRVVDDGEGMSPEDARVALRRHATSKLKDAGDLWGLPTFGFRGEALPSIAAVSRLTLATRTAEALAGTRLVVHAGALQEEAEIGMPTGTRIDVRDLFFNTPARLKFLKTEATETANISEALLRLALAHPAVHLRLRANGRVLMDLPPHRDLGERVRAALARRGAAVLHEAVGEESGCRVRAYLAAPEEAGAIPRNTFLYVGRRFIRDRSLLAALVMGYGDRLEKGRYPLAALFVEVPGPEVDINVHPQKLEVRFARAQEVYGAVRHIVAAGLAHAPWAAPTGPAAPAFTPALPPAAARPARGSGGALGPPAGWRPGRSSGTPLTAGEPTAPFGPPAPQPLNARFVASVGARFSLYAHAERLWAVDDHELRTRETRRWYDGLGGDRPVPHRLLYTVPVALPRTEGAGAREPVLLHALGFDIEPAGPGKIYVRGVPAPWRDADIGALVADLLSHAAALDAERIPTRVSEPLLDILAAHLPRQQPPEAAFMDDGADESQARRVAQPLTEEVIASWFDRDG